MHMIAKHVVSNNDVRMNKSKFHYDRKLAPITYKVDDLVLRADKTGVVGQSKKLNSPWQGPYRVIEQISDVTYRIKKVTKPGERNKHPIVVHHNNLKMYHGHENEQNQSSSSELSSLNTSEQDQALNHAQPTTRKGGRPKGSTNNKNTNPNTVEQAIQHTSNSIPTVSNRVSKPTQSSHQQSSLQQSSSSNQSPTSDCTDESTYRPPKQVKFNVPTEAVRQSSRVRKAPIRLGVDCVRSRQLDASRRD